MIGSARLGIRHAGLGAGPLGNCGPKAWSHGDDAAAPRCKARIFRGHTLRAGVTVMLVSSLALTGRDTLARRGNTWQDIDAKAKHNAITMSVTAISAFIIIQNDKYLG